MIVASPRTRKIFLWKGLFISWIYLGFIRNAIPSISTPLYFLHDFLILAIFLIYRPKKLSIRHTISWLILIFAIFLVFMKFESGNLSLAGFVQGVNLYCIGMLLFVSADSDDIAIKSLDLSRNIQISMVPNFLLSILQVPLKVPYFQKSEISNLHHLSSADGYIRAYGTFTSTTGFTLYLTVVFAYCLSCINQITKFKAILLQLVSLAMLLMSQSRTALAIVLCQYLIYFMISRRDRISSSFSFKNFRASEIRIGKWIGILVTLIFLIFPRTFNAFTTRISQASQSENSFFRLFSQQFSWIKSIDHSLFGDGLASHTIGVVGYSNISQQWIERDLDRILQEAGLILGLSIIFFRFYWALSLMKSFSVLMNNRDKFMVFLLPVLVITFLQGPLYGQNDTNIFGWFFLTIFVAKYRSTKTIN